MHDYTPGLSTCYPTVDSMVDSIADVSSTSASVGWHGIAVTLCVRSVKLHNYLALHWAGLVLGWVTACGQVNHTGM